MTASNPFAGDGEAAARARALQWSATPLGPVEGWPASLRTAAQLTMGTAAPALLLWGAELVQLPNDAWCAATRGEDGLGRPARDGWPELWRATHAVHPNLLQGEPVRDVRVGVGDGWLALSYAPVRDEAGGVAGAFVTASSPALSGGAERERLLDAVMTERNRLAATFDRSPSFMAVLRGPEHRFELTNAAYDRLVGRRVKAGSPVAEALPEVERQGFIELLDGVLATGRPFVGTGMPVMIDGAGGEPPELRYIDFVYAPITEADGSRSGIMVHGVDGTEQVRIREALQASEARYRSLFETMDQGFCVVEIILDERGRPRDYRFLEANPVFEAQTGLVNALGRTARELVPGLEQHWFDLYGGVARTGEPVRFQQGSEPMGRWFDVYAFRIDAPEELHVAILFTDQTAAHLAANERERLLRESEQARLEAEQARAEAQGANRAKSEFLAVMSHELRTPLNAIGGYAELLEMGIRGPVTPDQEADLGRIQSSQRHLLGLINEVLNYAKLETGTVQFDLDDVSANEVMVASYALLSPQARKRLLTLAVEECSPTVRARADEDKLRQILVNLLSNAVKFTPAGGRIDLHCMQRGEMVAFEVVDTGIGIAADKRDAVFEPFVQVRSDLSRTQEGTGLGLAISRELARGMGGDLALESEIGDGCRFTLLLPSATRPPSAP